jgi:hypothetical protein
MDVPVDRIEINPKVMLANQSFAARHHRRIPAAQA